jgi:hypothetical protein
MPSPGTYYSGTRRIAFLPDTKEVSASTLQLWLSSDLHLTSDISQTDGETSLKPKLASGCRSGSAALRSVSSRPDISGRHVGNQRDYKYDSLERNPPQD